MYPVQIAEGSVPVSEFETRTAERLCELSEIGVSSPQREPILSWRTRRRAGPLRNPKFDNPGRRISKESP